jgi:hypothetical protein
MNEEEAMKRMKAMITDVQEFGANASNAYFLLHMFLMKNGRELSKLLFRLDDNNAEAFRTVMTFGNIAELTDYVMSGGNNEEDDSVE